jgi:tetratricopeptide (TPR) repeat protein
VPISPAAPTSAAEAEVALNSGRFDLASIFFSTFVSNNPSNAWGHYMLGVSLHRKGDFKGAVRAFDRSFELDSTNAKTLFNNGRALLALGRDHEAFERIDAGRLLDSTSADGLRLLARAHAKLGNIDGALETYRRALVIDDDDVWTLNNLGVLYLDQGHPEAALGPLARAVVLKGSAPIFQNNLGMALERAGHQYAARLAYQRAVSADPSYAKAKGNLERLNLIVTDSTPSDGVVIEDLAEEFRLQVEMWKDGFPRPAVEAAATDSVPPTRR